MNLSALVIFELRRIFRDKNWIISQLVLPLIIYPIVYIIVPLVISKAVMSPQNLGGRVSISGQYSNLLVKNLSMRGFEIKKVQDALKSLDERKSDVAIVSVKPLENADNLGEMRLYVKGSRLTSALTAQKLQIALRDIYLELLSQKANVSLEKIKSSTPVFSNADNDIEKRIGSFGFLTVMLLLSLITFQTGIIGTEITATAHERGEFTSQLATPITSHKFIAVRLIVCLIAVGVLTFWYMTIYQGVGWLRPFFLESGFIAERALNFGNGGFQDWSALLRTSILSISNILVFSALTILIGIKLRSTKSTNNLYNPFSLIASGIATLPLFIDNFASIPDTIFLVPILNGCLAQVKLIVADLSPFALIITLISQAIFTVIVVQFAVYSLRHQD